MPDDLPLPIVETPDAEPFGPDGPTQTTPVGAAYLWWQALLHVGTSPNALHNLHTLTYKPSAWDYDNTRQVLDGRALTSFPVASSDPHICYVKFIPEHAGSTIAQFFDEALLDDIVYLTMVSNETVDSWMVWGISEGGYMPTVGQVYGTE